MSRAALQDLCSIRTTGVVQFFHPMIDCSHNRSVNLKKEELMSVSGGAEDLVDGVGLPELSEEEVSKWFDCDGRLVKEAAMRKGLYEGKWEYHLLQ